jgi:acyl-CoA reductase-like NAD-dependent aldehyde dehydrogenase
MNDIATHGLGEAALADIEQQFRSMHEKSRAAAPTKLGERRRLLRALRQIISDSTSAFVEAIDRDYGFRSPSETLLAEIVPALMMVSTALGKVGAWMRPERRGRTFQFFPGRNEVHWQPKGVVLIISPWNYPLQLAVGPLAAALAAGNRVIVKPSEFTPATSALLKQLLEGVLGRDRVTVATGGPDIAEGLCRLPFDHILFTGSTSVGKKVMAAAAENLTPVTLELGGKSPAIVHAECDLPLAVRRIARGKLLNAGQTCIAPDYALVQRAKVPEFLELYRQTVGALYPRLLDNPDYTAIINAGHYERLSRMADEARSGGARLETVDPAGELGGAIGSPQTRKMAPTAIVGATDAMAVTRQEIFGPLLPIVPYDTLDQAIAYVNARPRPLALYYFDTSGSRIRQMLRSTVSGGVTVNDTVFHFAQESLPFGGIGPSGMGSYHGHDGFQTFSHAKGTFLQSRYTLTSLLAPPYGDTFRNVIDFALRQNGGRPPKR